MRAAASSIASGSPSSRRQISATAAAFSSVSAKSGCDRLGALDEQRDRRRTARHASAGGSCVRVRQRQRRHRELLLAAQTQRARGWSTSSLQAAGRPPAGRRRSGAAGSTCSKLSSTSSSCLSRRYAASALERAACSPASRTPSACGDRGSDQRRVARSAPGRRRRRRRRTRPAASAADLQRQAGLAHAAGAGQRHEARRRFPEQGAQPCELLRTTNQRRRLDWQVGRVAIKALERRKVIGQTGDAELSHPLGFKEVAKPVRSEVNEATPAGRLP